jgi:hypothetical protein
MGLDPSTPGQKGRPLSTETAVRRTCITILRRVGFTVALTSERRRGFSHLSVGFPYTVIVHPGKQIVAFVEFKSPSGVQRPDQRRFQQTLEAAGGTYLLIDHVQVLWTFLEAHGLLAPEPVHAPA